MHGPYVSCLCPNLSCKKDHQTGKERKLEGQILNSTSWAISYRKVTPESSCMALTFPKMKAINCA